VRIEARYGPEKFDQSNAVTSSSALPVPIVGNTAWRNGSQESVVVRQILFDGFASIHDIWRQSARVNAAAFRVRERTELIALDAAEAYVDVVRYLRLVGLGEQNVAAHEKIFSNVNSRFSGGRAGEGDLEQARERVENARATLAEFRKSLDDARAKYRKVVGLEPANLRFPGPLAGLPSTRDEALAVTVRFNPTILAAQADADAAKHAFRVTDGAFVPTFSLEGRATHNDNTYPYLGVTHDDYSGKVVMSWDILRGGQDAWRRSEMAERHTETTMRHARLQRDALESIDKAWSADNYRNSSRRLEPSVAGRPEDHRCIPEGIRAWSAFPDRPAERRKPVFQCGRIAYFVSWRHRLRRLSIACRNGNASRVSQSPSAGGCSAARYSRRLGPIQASHDTRNLTGDRIRAAARFQCCH
jgi:adhesin transport system outer membrane protein